jgi:predicted HTH transcriptional regulator
LEKIRDSDIFIGLIGENYGNKKNNGISATEKEFNEFIKGKNKVNTFMFILENIKIDKNTKNFIEKAEKFTYSKFTRINLEEKIKKSLYNFLSKNKLLIHTDFDDRIVFNGSCKDIDLKQVNLFLAKSDLSRSILRENTKNTLLNKFQVLEEVNDKIKPKNIAILFFGKNIPKSLPQYEIRLTKFSDDEGTVILDFVDLKDPIFPLLDKCKNFIISNTKTAQEIIGFDRNDIDEYPYEALREGIINAVAHRDYNIDSAPIMISIYRNRLEILSPGKLMPPATLDDLGLLSVHRNKKICELFRETRDMERRATGIHKMQRLMKEHGLKPPKFEEFGEIFKVTFYGSENMEDLLFNNTKKNNLRELGLNDRQLNALEYIYNNKKLSTKEYIKIFNVSRPTASRDLNKLVELGFLKVKYNGKFNEFFIDKVE